MATTTTSADGRKIKVAVSSGETTGPVFVAQDCVVTGNPGASGTILVQATWSSVEDVNAGAANWFNWDAGTVATRAVQALVNATAVRFVAAGAAAICEVSR